MAKLSRPIIIEKRYNSVKAFFNRPLVKDVLFFVAWLLAFLELTTWSKCKDLFKSKNEIRNEKTFESIQIVNKKPSINPIKLDEKETQNYLSDTNYIKPPVIKGIFIKDISKRKLLKVSFMNKTAEMTIKNGQFERPLVAQYCDVIKIKLRIIDDRVFAYVELYDVTTDDHIGTMAYDKWIGYKENKAIFIQPGDDFLDIIDTKNSVIFSMCYIGGALTLGGYFTTPDSKFVFIMANDPPFLKNGDITKLCIDKSLKGWQYEVYKQGRHIIRAASFKGLEPHMTIFDTPAVQRDDY